MAGSPIKRVTRIGALALIASLAAACGGGPASPSDAGSNKKTAHSSAAADPLLTDKRFQGEPLDPGEFARLCDKLAATLWKELRLARTPDLDLDSQSCGGYWDHRIKGGFREISVHVEYSEITRDLRASATEALREYGQGATECLLDDPSDNAHNWLYLVEVNNGRFCGAGTSSSMPGAKANGHFTTRNTRVTVTVLVDGLVQNSSGRVLTTPPALLDEAIPVRDLLVDTLLGELKKS